ncbi:UDP-N-acetylmuramoyl-L-alanine--D-glutamate ligase [Sodalinema gerasimenkoae]|uniref:UDP-N-acetylmuramoyl-L-alanine--D-glutamate ligase n=1 Tax=Sodalinema gerasimenkoae TaxID=2862348 RepID=UPI001359DBEA|nr:UDP-N-acetylmuramoyl-L-alanine--D-glutamate ligase [Sodalinema gerasimenkoae]
MSTAHIIGLGKSGLAAARLLKQQGWQVTVSDRGTGDSLSQQQHLLAQDNIPVSLGHVFDPKTAQHLDLLVISPGVPWDLPNLQQARHLGIETIGEMELAWRYLQTYPWLGITGTNGKTTTTALAAAIFQGAGLKAPACGNIGHAACELALTVTQQDHPLDWVVAEMSSYQIESSSTLTPRIGIWTTFTPDHLNRHQTLENYYNIKAKLLQSSDVQIFNGDDPHLRKHREDWPNAYWTSVDNDPSLTPFAAIDGDWVVVDGARIVSIQALQMPGRHNQQNLLMAVAAARLAGIKPEAIAQAISQFRGVPHRLEVIGTWQDIRFINDSKATNYDAALVGLTSVRNPVILIAGGDPKDGDATTWLEAIQRQAAFVLLIGDAAESFAQMLDGVGYSEYKIVGTLEAAVEVSRDLAQKYQAQTVLLSPACASFDQFPNFEVRGQVFQELCERFL